MLYTKYYTLCTIFYKLHYATLSGNLLYYTILYYITQDNTALDGDELCTMYCIFKAELYIKSTSYHVGHPIKFKVEYDELCVLYIILFEYMLFAAWRILYTITITAAPTFFSLYKTIPR